jgi:protein-L-isoaspartate O-methyltransferase
MTDWRPLAEAMAASIDDRMPQHWRDAVASVPRHVIVPEFRIVGAGPQEGLTPAVDALDVAYQDRLLFVGRDREHLFDWSRPPSMLLRLFEATDIRPGHRVLVAGINRGYDAALLAHVLGDNAVFVVDPDPVVVDETRARLASAGLHPTLGVGWGLPSHGPFDRILVTNEVRAVRWDWAGQLAPGGILGIDIAIGRTAGGRFMLRREGDRLTGGFAPTFRGQPVDRMVSTLPDLHREPGDRSTATEGTTMLGLWQGSTLEWLVWQASAPRPDLTIGGGGDAGGSFFADTDGSWAEVEVFEQDRRRMRTTGPHTRTTDDTVEPYTGPRSTWQGGPARLWDEWERAHQIWTDLGEPDWPRFGYTVTEDRQWLWVDNDENGPAAWVVRS